MLKWFFFINKQELMFVKYIIKLFFQFHFFAVVSDIEPQPSCQQHHHYHHHIGVVVIITFVPTIIILSSLFPLFDLLLSSQAKK